MKIFTFTYIGALNVVACDMIIAGSLKQAINIRRNTIKENVCPSEKCIVRELELLPGILVLLTPTLQNYTEGAIPCITNGKEMKYGTQISNLNEAAAVDLSKIQIRDLYNLLNIPSSSITRFINSCHYNDVMTIQDLLRYRREEVVKFRWMGYKTLMVVGDAIEKHFNISWK